MPKVVTAENPVELQEMINDSSAMRAMFKAGADGDTGPFEEFISGYRAKMFKNDPDLLQQNKEAFENGMVNFLREHGVRDDKFPLNFDPNDAGPVQRQGKNTIYNKAAMGAKYDGNFADLADFTYNISDSSVKDPELSGKLKRLKNDASSLKPSDGGFLIPENLRAEALRLALETAVVRSRARVFPMDSLRVPIPTVDVTSHASSVFGGITGYWTEEGATLTESKPKFGRVVLEAHKLTLYVEVPNELLNDSRPSYGTFINEMFPEAIAWFEDLAFFVGHGVGEPLGFLNAPAKVAVARTGANTVDWEEIVAMYCRMLPQSLNRAVWVVAPDVLPELLTMVIAGGTSPIWMGGGQFPSAGSAPLMSLLGRPIIVSEKARALGTEGDISFVDFGHYLLGDRQAMTARQSEDFRFNEDVTAFRVIERLDGRPWLPSALTPANGSSATLSAFITLAAA